MALLCPQFRLILVLLRQTFLHNIRKKSLLSATEIASVFSNVEALVPVNEKLLLDLKVYVVVVPSLSFVFVLLCVFICD